MLAFYSACLKAEQADQLAAKAAASRKALSELPVTLRTAESSAGWAGIPLCSLHDLQQEGLQELDGPTGFAGPLASLPEIKQQHVKRTSVSPG